MTDAEKIEAAAKRTTRVRGTFTSQDIEYISHDFVDGVEWRDENPSPEVEALVKAVEKYLGDIIYEDLKESLRAYRASLEKK